MQGKKKSPTRVQLMTTTGLGPEPLLAAIASHFEDLVDPDCHHASVVPCVSPAY